MTRESILDWTRRQPFEPFILKASDGTEHEIWHPDMVIPASDYVAVGIASKSEQVKHAAERVTWVSMFHIVKLVPMSKVSHTKNGKNKKN